MKLWQGFRVGVLTVVMTASLFAQGNQAPAGAPPPGGAAAGQGRGPAGPGLALTSTSFEDGGVIPNAFTQAEATYRSPHLGWTNVPANVQSFALLVTDVDVAPMRSSDPFVHWVVFNIPGNARGLAEGIVPDAGGDIVQGRNGRNASAWLGPGAPAGPYHHYVFELFALDSRLTLTNMATRAEVMAAMNGHVMAKAALTGRFHR